MSLRLLILAALSALAVPVNAAPDCRMFEVEVASVDASGGFHALFNFGQSLPLGDSWSMEFPGEHGTLKASVTWDGEGSDRKPKITLALRSQEPTALTGVAVLEKLVWDSLFGPEAFATSDGKPFMLPKAGRAFAVASAVPAPCGEKPDG